MKKTKNNPLLAAEAGKGKNVNPAAIAGQKAAPGSKNGNGRAKTSPAAPAAAAPVLSAAAQRAMAKMEQVIARGEALKAGGPVPKLTAAETRALRALVNADPTFNSGLRFNTSGLMYVGEDPEPVPPPSGGAKVKLDLAARTDADLAAFGESHVVSITGNANFPNPVPSATVFGEGLAALEGLMSLVESRRLELKQLVEQKDAARAVFQNLMTQRGAYVETASNGNADLIHSAGLETRKSRTKVGELSYPNDLRVEQSQLRGALSISWKSVRHARTYLLECAEVVEGQERVWKQVYAGGKPSTVQKNLVPGKIYEFRVAAMGGSDGQSEWSLPVARMAA